MAHNLVVESDAEHGVTFRCTKCNAPIEFVHPAFGEPNPVQTDTGWVPPENPEQWMGPCND